MHTDRKREARLPKLPAGARQQLIDAGCEGRPLDSFVARWKEIRSTSKGRKDSLGRFFKREIGRLAGGLERIAEGVEQLGRTKVFDGNTWEVLAPYFPDTPGTVPPSDFFSAYATDIRQRAELLKKFYDWTRNDWDESPDAVYALLSLEYYCREATNGRATIGQIAGLLREEEPAVRQRLWRIGKNWTPDSRLQLEQAVKDYIAACPSGDLTFDEWRTRKLMVILQERTPSEITAILAAESPWYREI